MQADSTSSVNIPWPNAGHGDAEYIHAFQQIVMPIAYEYAPDLVMSKRSSSTVQKHCSPTVSAGFDAADGDELGGCHVTPAAYGHMTHALCAVANGKVVVALEVSSAALLTQATS